jgi:HEAT repeat protein
VFTFRRHKRAVWIAVLGVALVAGAAWFLRQRDVQNTPECRAGVLVQELRECYDTPSGIEKWLVKLKLTSEKKHREVEVVVDDLSHLGPRAVPTLVRALEDKRWWVRAYSAWALGGIGPAAKDAVPALVLSLKNDSDGREFYAKALGQIGPAASAAVPELILALEDSDVRVRKQSARALGKIGPTTKEVIPALIAALSRGGYDDIYGSLAADAAWALGEIGPAAEDAIPELTRHLKDFWEPNKLAARNALAKIQKTATTEPAKAVGKPGKDR